MTANIDQVLEIEAAKVLQGREQKRHSKPSSDRGEGEHCSTISAKCFFSRSPVQALTQIIVGDVLSRLRRPI
jgi:hypothetical protein